MTNKIISFPLLLAAVCTLVSCSKVVADGDESDKSTANSRLVVRAGATGGNTQDSGTGDDATVNWPVNVYVFSAADGKCKAVSTLGSADDNLSFELAAGNYDICAVGGAENYTLPAQSEATKESLLTLKDGKAHGDLMTASGSVTLTAGNTNTLELSMNRNVMKVGSVSITGVPANMTAMTVTISPLYKSITLSGEYSEVGGSHTVTLEKSADDATVWSSQEPVFLLPAYRTVSITVSMEQNGDTKSFQSNISETLEANTIINLTGTYDAGKILMSGTIKGTKWGETKNIVFTFGEGTVTKGDENPSNPGTSSDIPQVGSAYLGCYVVTSETTVDGKTKLLLMSPKDNYTWSFAKGKEEELKKDVNLNIEKLAVEGVSGWRLPTLEEIKMVLKNAKTINENIKKLDSSLGITPLYVSSYAYFCQNGESINTYSYWGQDSDGSDKDNLNETKNIGNGASNILRAFATVTIMN